MATDELVISQSEYKARLEKVRSRLKASELDALYLTNPTRILYASGFAHITTERPLALVVPREEPLFLMGPQLEYDHVKRDCPLIQEVLTYPDYPGKLHPMRLFARFLAKKGLSNGRIATDSLQGAAEGWGFRGPAINNLLPKARFYEMKDIVDEMRLVKSSQEVRLLKESARWSKLAHDILLENVRPGSSDVLVGLKASYEAFSQMLRKLGKRYRQFKWGLSPVIVGFRGQVGPESSIPHAVFSKRKIRKGDVMVSEAGVEIGGYTSELERTIVVGEASPRTARYYRAMLKAQTAALEAFHPGVRCSIIDEVARKVLEAEGVTNFVQHHAGHGIGLDGHEPPWLDPGDRTIMKAGMVFSCEPGLYIPGQAGFRHSDTVVLTRSSVDIITEYPREMDDLTV